jgi:hypothetical protein
MTIPITNLLTNLVNQVTNLHPKPELIKVENANPPLNPQTNPQGTAKPVNPYSPK